MAKLWLKNDKLVMCDGRLAYADECPCGEQEPKCLYDQIDTSFARCVSETAFPGYYSFDVRLHYETVTGLLRAPTITKHREVINLVFAPQPVASGILPVVLTYTVNNEHETCEEGIWGATWIRIWAELYAQGTPRMVIDSFSVTQMPAGVHDINAHVNISDEGDCLSGADFV